MLLGLAVAYGTAGLKAEDPADFFGKKESSGTALIGIIYDLKQDQKRQPTGATPDTYAPIVDDFLLKNWDESILNRYFRAARPLYITQIYIPMMGAGEAPKAFGVADIMKPSMWVVHYKGQITPPEDGTYRFLCYSDDLIAVGVNGKTVCAGPHPATVLSAWKTPVRETGPAASNGALIYGDWLPLKKDEPIDFDVIMGERPGGGFSAFLLYEKQGAEYPRQNGVIQYPIFQLAPMDTKPADPGRGPVFSTGPLWQAIQ